MRIRIEKWGGEEKVKGREKGWEFRKSGMYVVGEEFRSVTMG